ncbi:helix-turn-helix domain-containing protein [Gracilibacillus caseinilyticus]|uniref:Helix-turn-helix domain-containing protein n=1 Tax=Gracilibacillus caseinilyticus TaxID=2932256 RepID=A0ABY4EV72_9BACI|nr:helix-turn-helix domain-containing protein [Gracilibacillus caseinilyticus]UOQ47549.1 helix-turn-helix domain-containing protein [Gracilibacillus caseinilyticus]
MFEFILLDCMLKLNGERTMYNIYHLLTAKKSTQTIQDSNIFGLTAYFGIYKSMTRKQFDEEVQRLEKKNCIVMEARDTVKLTNKGMTLHKQQGQHYLPLLTLNGIEYEQHAEKLLQHVILFVQTITHLHMRKHSFIPIVDDIATQRFVKTVWRNNQVHGTQRMLDQLYEDLYRLLEFFPSDHAAIFVDRLSTDQRIGLSRYQLAEKFQMTIHDISIINMNIIHNLCRMIVANDSTSLLKQLYPVRTKQLLISDSANQTLYYVKKKLSISEISSIRRLKESTIKDHLIEIAYAAKEFQWQHYVNHHDYQLIQSVIINTNSKKLKDLKVQLPTNINYFQIKLVLAMEQQGERRKDDA